ncbi:TPA: hypothetical protein EYP75_05435 [Candidatus Bathyarchaeota archaeon]|nr:hypothetical protein [Candidatus Bathyarchaeota archaeon]
MIKKNIVYFDAPGLENTCKVLELVKKRAKETGIDTVVLASTRGDTAKKAMESLNEKKLIVVGIGRERFSADVMKAAQEKGVLVIFSKETDYHYPKEMKIAFRRFGQGMKVSVEDVVIACRRKVLKEGVDVISLAGSSRGADTAIIIRSSKDFSTVKIREVICMPR